MSTNPKINEEQIEAASADRQREMNERRAERKATLSPSELARLDVIEECSAKLEAAGVPFLLMGASNDPHPDHGYSSWWQFNKMDYTLEERGFKVHANRSADGVVSLTCSVMRFITSPVYGSFVYYDSQGRARRIFKDGNESDIPLPPEHGITPPSATPPPDAS